VNKHAQRGLTLIELVVALAVLSIGLMGAVSMYHIGLDTMKAGEESRAALTALRNEVDYQRALPFDQLVDVVDASFHSTAGLESLVNLRTAVTVRPSADTPGLKEIDASVTWTGEHGRSVTKRLATLVADKGGV
jgi:prepilin-type N-terminal cleavage/methylation domain-containing protein